MFERIYAFFLRLYPARFRAAYEREALQLLRDRLCDETGVVRRARLGFDLVMDFAVGWRQSFVNGRRTARTAVPVESPGAPILFRLLEQEPTRPASFLFGTILSLAALGAFAFVLTHGRRYQPFAGSEDSTSPVESVLAQVNHAAGQGTPEPSASTAVSVRATGASSPADKQSGLPPPPPPPGAIAVDVRDRVVRTVAANLEDHYFDRPRAHAAAAMLLAHEGHGDYAALPVSDALAHRLTADIRQSTGIRIWRSSTRNNRF